MGKTATFMLASIVCAICAGLIYVFAGALGKDPQLLDSVVTGRKITDASTAAQDKRISLILPRLDNGALIALQDLPEPPYLLNIWGSWCPACHLEHGYLIELQQRIPIIGINWPAGNPGERENARAFLAAKGNPYTLVLSDPEARLIIDLGVYGAPETFLVGSDGTLLKRHAGPLDPKIWNQEFAPLLLP